MTVRRTWRILAPMSNYKRPVATDEDRKFAAEAIAQGYRQTSGKYRMLAKVPEGYSGSQALAGYSGRTDWGGSKHSNRPAGVMAEDACAEHFRRCYAPEDCHMVMTPGQFIAYKDLLANPGEVADLLSRDPLDAPPMFGGIDGGVFWIGPRSPLKGVQKSGGRIWIWSAGVYGISVLT